MWQNPYVYTRVIIKIFFLDGKFLPELNIIFAYSGTALCPVVERMIRDARGIKRVCRRYHYGI